MSPVHLFRICMYWPTIIIMGTQWTWIWIELCDLSSQISKPILKTYFLYTQWYSFLLINKLLILECCLLNCLYILPSAERPNPNRISILVRFFNFTILGENIFFFLF